MNALDIWSGHEYAYIENKPNNMDAPRNCDKVRAIKVIKRLESGNKRETAFVLAEVIERNGTSWPYYNVGEQYELRARYFVDFWSDYAHRREEIEKEANEREAKRRAEAEERNRRIAAAQAERERVEQENRERKERERNQLVEAFSKKTGIPENWVVADDNLIGVRDNTATRLWLSVPLRNS